MSNPVAYGIDFGTTNSSIAIGYDDGSAELLPVDGEGSTILPSIIYLDSGGNELAGNDAVRQYLIPGPPETRRLLSSLKTVLADPGFVETTSPWGQTHTIDSLVAVLLRRLKRSADHSLGTDVRRAVIGFPVLFVGAEGEEHEARQNLALQRLELAAGEAGFEEVGFLDEPTAALETELDPGLLVALDFGGGTFDVSIVHLADDEGAVLATQGAGVGGELLDTLLFDAKVAGTLGLTGEYWDPVGEKLLPVPGALLRMRTLREILDLVNDGRSRTALDHMERCDNSDVFKIVEEIIYGGHSYQFFRSIEQAKIELSDLEASSISFRRPKVDIQVEITREEFSELIAENLDLLEERIVEALEQADVDAGDVDLVVRTGGSAQIPAFVERLEHLFDPARIQQRDAFGTVALGLATHAAREEWEAD